MNFRKTASRRGSTDINMTALIDVVFILLIFFLITSTFVQNSGFDVQLPSTSGKTDAQPANPINIGITKEGNFVFNGNEVSPEQLEAQLQQYHKSHADALVLLEADTAAKHGKVVQAMDLARQAGFEKLNIATLEQAQ